MCEVAQQAGARLEGQQQKGVVELVSRIQV